MNEQPPQSGAIPPGEGARPVRSSPLGSFLANSAFYGAGLAMLTLASVRHRVGGYRKPTAFPPSDWSRSVAHVLDIVQDWDRALVLLGAHPSGFRGCDVLELGPGATLGTGILLAGLGARSYQAVDRFPLASATPAGFYRALSETELPSMFDEAAIRAAVEALQYGHPEPVAYATDPEFDILRATANRRFDIVVSNAAFEHFADIDAVIAQITTVARPGAAFIAMVDFQTHSRGLRETDPNSIYRYSDRVYRALAFPGQPNRQRPDDYLGALARHGWSEPKVRPVDVAKPGYLDWSKAGLDAAFLRPGARMDVLTGIVTARKS